MENSFEGFDEEFIMKLTIFVTYTFIWIVATVRNIINNKEMSMFSLFMRPMLFVWLIYATFFVEQVIGLLYIIAVVYCYVMIDEISNIRSK